MPSLLATGFGLAWYRTASDSIQGAIAGLSILPGYLVMSIVGAFLFEITLVRASGAPDLLPAIFLAGIVLPAVFAGTGGLLGGFVDRRRRRLPGEEQLSQ